MTSNTKRILLAIGFASVVIVVIVLIATLSATGPREIITDEETSWHPCPQGYGDHPLLLVSLDGFRPDYMERGHTPYIRSVAFKGVRPEYMIASYPTVTFPNHYTIVTGLYPESHGIIANSFYDREFGQRFSLSSNHTKEGKWWGGEPIWNTVTRHGKKSATFFWPGSDADINGKRPTYWRTYDSSISYEDRILQVFEWLTMPKEERPSFISVYFDEPDHALHGHGPDSKEVDEQLVRVDGIIEMLMEGLRDRNLTNCVNVMIVSDHGGTKAGKENVIDLHDYIPELLDEAVLQRSVVSRIGPKEDTEEAELEILRELACKRDDMRVYRKEGLPKRMHFAKNPRIEDILIEMDLGRTIQFNSSWALMGQHGYDNYYSDMNALFIGYGPAFKHSTIVKPFQNTELYNLMCYLLDLEPAENNGTWSSLQHLLYNENEYLNGVNKRIKPTAAELPDLNMSHKFWNMSGCDEGYYNEYIERAMSSLKLNETQREEIEKKHVPYGFPLYKDGFQNEVLALYHPTHITGYSVNRKMPLWTSFTLNKGDAEVAWIEPSLSQWASDFRLPKNITPTCDTFSDFGQANYSMFSAFPINLGEEKSGAKNLSYLVSDGIPVHSSLKGDFLELMKLLPNWVEKYGHLNVVVGPLFDTVDNPHVGHLTDRQISVPSDLYIILTRCSYNDTFEYCHPSYLETRSFIFHQYQPVRNCFKSQEEYFMKFSAPIRDIKHFTQLTFYPKSFKRYRMDLEMAAHADLWPLS